ncbi:MAG: hypothetical protein VX460_08395 [Planctomycetota bacterium]|nr:hypothetical protein [Planctomycetota bacterium]
MRALTAASLRSHQGFNALERLRNATVEESAAEATLTDGISIVSNTGLQFVDGFNMLRENRVGLTVFENPVLTSVGGFGMLEFFRSIIFADNPLLETIPSFESLRGNPFPSLTEGAQVQFNNNTVLRDIPGFNALEDPGAIKIRRNAGLLDISGFNGVTGFTNTSLSGVARVDIRIESNDSLEAITGFSALGIAAALTIRDNAALTSLAGVRASPTRAVR